MKFKLTARLDNCTVAKAGGPVEVIKSFRLDQHLHKAVDHMKVVPKVSLQKTTKLNTVTMTCLTVAKQISLIFQTELYLPYLLHWYINYSSTIHMPSI